MCSAATGSLPGHNPFHPVAGFLFFVADRHRVLKRQGHGEAAHVEAAPAGIERVNFLGEGLSIRVRAQNPNGELHGFSWFPAFTHDGATVRSFPANEISVG
jgi:hypothetical protein